MLKFLVATVEHTPARMHAHIRMHTYSHTSAQRYGTHAHVPATVLPCTHKHTHTRAHTHAQARTHTRTHARTHAHTHTLSHTSVRTSADIHIRHVCLTHQSFVGKYLRPILMENKHKTPQQTKCDTKMSIIIMYRQEQLVDRLVILAYQCATGEAISQRLTRQNRRRSFSQPRSRGPTIVACLFSISER